MGAEGPAEKKSVRHGRWLQRGESPAARIGVVVFAILVIAMGASTWWSRRMNRRTVTRSSVEQIEAIGTVLSESAEAMLSARELSSLRRLVTEISREYHLDRCRIVLPGNRVIADADPRQINLAELPERWSGVVSSAVQADGRGMVSRSYPLLVPGRGAARLEIVAAVRPDSAGAGDIEVGLGIIGIVSLASVLLVYRWIRSRARIMGSIREALMAFGSGETDPGLLTVSEELGPEAEAWNALVGRLHEQERRLAMNEVRHAIANASRRHDDLDVACNAVPHGLIVVNSKMRITYANGAAARLLRASTESMADQEVSKFVAKQHILTAIQAAAQGKGPRRVTLEAKEPSINGVLRFTVSPVLNGDRRSAVVTIEDVTQLRVSEEARNSFLAHATHELRTPLTNIRLYVETALEDGETNPTLRAEALNVINQESRRLERMVGDMLSVVEIEAGSYKLRRDDLKLDEILQALEKDYKAQADEKQVQLTFNLPPKMPTTQGDRDKVTLALHNLIGNALKYTPPGGRVDVTADVVDENLIVEVSDTGIGISEADQQRIFEKFYRANDERVSKIVGSGLGLALAREVIRLHGGDIVVQSELDKGSTFTLTLPVVAEVAV